MYSIGARTKTEGIPRDVEWGCGGGGGSGGGSCSLSEHLAALFHLPQITVSGDDDSTMQVLARGIMKKSNDNPCPGLNDLSYFPGEKDGIKAVV